MSNVKWTLSVLISSLRFPFVTELVDREKYGRNVPKEVIISEVALESMNKSKIGSNFLWKINDIFKISYFQKWVYIFHANTIDLSLICFRWRHFWNSPLVLLRLRTKSGWRGAVVQSPSVHNITVFKHANCKQNKKSLFTPKLILDVTWHVLRQRETRI